MLYEAIPVWERAYAVSETKRSVEGVAGTRGADKHFAESPFVKLPGGTTKFTGRPFAKPHVPCVVASQLCFVHERASTSSC